MTQSRRCILLCLVIAGVLLLSLGCGGSGLREPGRSNPQVISLRTSIVATARSQLGTRYCWGGESPGQGFDCSGLVWWVYRQHGIGIPRTTREQYRAGKEIDDLRDVLAGDIVLFRIGWRGLHSGIATGEGTFVHSPKSGGRVREDSLGASFWSGRFLEARRIVR